MSIFWNECSYLKTWFWCIWFSKQKYFGSTLQEDKKQEQVIDDGRKDVNRILDKKEIEILKVQLQNPDLSDRARSNRQKKLDKLQSMYGEKV